MAVLCGCPAAKAWVNESNMRSLRNVLEQAQKNGVAVGHFNVADLALLKTIFARLPTLADVPVKIRRGLRKACLVLAHSSKRVVH